MCNFILLMLMHLVGIEAYICYYLVGANETLATLHEAYASAQEGVWKRDNFHSLSTNYSVSLFAFRSLSTNYPISLHTIHFLCLTLTQ